MASNPRGEGSYSNHSNILIQDPHFFKVVMFPSDQGLKIPDAFMRKYGRDLQDLVLLKVPTGASWKVQLVHFGNGTMLRKGWEEFAKHCSIKKFYFLVFRYKGNSEFHVFIFDPTALEIEYPNKDSCVRTELKGSDDDEQSEKFSAQVLEKVYQKTPASKGKRARVEDIEEDVSIEILDDLSQWKPKTRSSHKESQRSKSKNTCYTTTSSGNEKPKQNQGGDSGCSKQKMNKGKSSAGCRRPLRSSTSIANYKTVTDKEKFKSYEKAKAFTSSNPFFISLMQPSYVSNKFYLEIPRAFLRGYISKKQTREFYMLHVSGRTVSWPVTMNLRPSGRSCQRTFGIGWEKFVQDNGLRVGDVCVFELVPGTRKFNVTIFIN